MQEVTIIKDASVLAVKLVGEIDSKNADEFYDTVLAAYAEAPRDIEFDCAELAFIDSTTLGTFVKILKHARENGHTLKLKKLRPRLKKLFVICALDAIMEIE